MKLNEIQFAIMVIMNRLTRVDKRMIGQLIYELSWNKWLSIHPDIISKEMKPLMYQGLIAVHPRKASLMRITPLGKLWFRSVVNHDGLLCHQTRQLNRKHDFFIMHPK